MLEADTSDLNACPLLAETKLSIHCVWMEELLEKVDTCTDIKDLTWPLVSPTSQLQIS